jgi:uncharacterized protein (TIGR03067 family)
MNWLPALALALMVGAPGPKEAPKKADSPSIVGEWECVELVGGGRKADAKEASQCHYEFTADGKFRVNWGGQNIEGTYTTDAKKDPAEIDCATGNAAKKNLGIFKVEKDTLIHCFADGGGDRPTKFESPAGTRILLLTFKRVEKKKE